MNEQEKYEWLRILARAGSPEEAAQMGGVSLQEANGIWDSCRDEALQLPRQDAALQASDEMAGGIQNGIPGIDISQHQGTPDFQKIKGAGVKFVIARAGFGRIIWIKASHATPRNATGWAFRWGLTGFLTR